MGRKPTKAGAIPRFRVRRQKSGVVHYYYDHGGKPRKETPLGRDYGVAIRRWAELEHAQIPSVNVLTFRHVADRYHAEVIPAKAFNTQRMQLLFMNALFGVHCYSFRHPARALEAWHITQKRRLRSNYCSAYSKTIATSAPNTRSSISF